MDLVLLQSLEEADPEVFDLCEREKTRQYRGLELIASENFTSRAVMEANASAFTNKYSEGLPGQRYYGGNEYVDEIETLCQRRALAAFHLDPEEWGVNVQPYSGSTANFSVLTALLKPFDRLMGLDLPSGGHLTHGYQTAKKKISSTSIYFQSMPYQVNQETGYVDYEKLEEHAKLFRPNLVICGGSAYPRDWDFKRLRDIADQHGAYLMMDMAHTSGLIATQLMQNPFEYCDVVTSTTHKSLRGPRAGIIFYRKNSDRANLKGLETRVNQAVFPANQGGPHNHTIAALAVALKMAVTPDFIEYQKQVIRNAQVLAQALMEAGHRCITNGTDNHCVLWDVRPKGLTGSKLEKLYELASITLNKNSVVGDVSALSPGGVRLGTPALTSRGFKEEEFKKVAAFLLRGIDIALEIQAEYGKMLKDFVKGLNGNSKIAALKEEVEEFAGRYQMPGFDVKALKYSQN
eukprot:Clim_evm15s155 gene=Clim_evmTU15s155